MIGFINNQVSLKMKRTKRTVPGSRNSSVGAVLGSASGKGIERCIQCLFFKGGRRREELYTLDAVRSCENQLAETPALVN